MKIKHEHIRMAMNVWAHPDGEKVPAAKITKAYFELGMTFPELYDDSHPEALARNTQKIFRWLDKDTPDAVEKMQALSSESLEQLAHQNLSAWMIDVIGHAISGTQERELSLAELSWWAVRNQVADALPEAVLRRSLGLRAEKIRSMYRESDIVPGEQTATSILKQRTKNLAPLPHAHQQQNPPQEKTVVSIAVDPESPESFMKRPKRRRWVNEKYTRWVKTQPCACCGKPADDPHHLIGHGQGGIGTKAHDIFTLPLCREHHNELHADPLAFEEKHGSQIDLIFRFLDRAFATGVLG